MLPHVGRLPSGNIVGGGVQKWVWGGGCTRVGILGKSAVFRKLILEWV